MNYQTANHCNQPFSITIGHPMDAMLVPRPNPVGAMQDWDETEMNGLLSGIGKLTW